MALQIVNTNYAGEVLEHILTIAATGNEIVEKGLIHIEAGVSDSFSIPRLKTSTMLQKRKEMPGSNDSKGNFSYSERSLNPKNIMAYTEFNPRSFERLWRPFQPKGALVFSELPANVQSEMLAALAKQVRFELGGHFINGVYSDQGDGNLFDGVVKRMEEATDKVVATTTETSVIGQLNDLYDAIPDAMIDNPDLRIIMSTADVRKYNKELIDKTYKGIDYNAVAEDVFRGVKVERLSQWPAGLFVATIASDDTASNLWAGVNLSSDEDVIQIDKVSNAGELYFFKLLMKADTQIAFGEEVVWLNTREETEEDEEEETNTPD